MDEQQVLQRPPVDLKKRASNATRKGGIATPLLVFAAALIAVLMGIIAFSLSVRVIPSAITPDMIAQNPSLESLSQFCTKAITFLPTFQKYIQPVFFTVIFIGMAAVWAIYHIFFDDRLKRSAGAWYFPVLSGCLTLLIVLIGYMQIGMWPFGEKSAMIVDMHHQYAPMLSQLRDMLLNGGSVLYTFEVGSGTSFIPLFAYYLASPFNVLLALFPQAYLAEGILLITLIKITLSGAFMTLCVQYVFKRRNFAAVAVGIMYALSMYMLAYSWDVMWLDCVMMLPLCIMGFERMVVTGKCGLYVLSLAYSLYSNYYIGFMICIFMVLYFIFHSIRTFRLNGFRFVRRFLFSALHFAGGSLLAGGLAAAILLPAFLSLGSTSAAGGSLPGFETYFNIFELVGRGLFAVEPTIRSGNLPNTYCGVLAVLTLPIFLTLNRIPLGRRLAYLGLFGAMSLSLVIKPLDLIWHGLHSPNDLPFRYSFLFSFVLLLILYEVLHAIEDISPLQIGGSILCVAAYLIWQEQFGSESYSDASLYISFVLVLIYGVVLFLVSQKKFLKESAYMLLVVFISVELLFNTGETFRQLNNNEHYTNHADYLDNNTTLALQETVAKMEELGDEEANGDFYRMEFLPRRTTTDTALYDYRGITIFASSGSYNMTRFMGSLGYDVNGVNSVLYKSYVPTADSLVGIKYVALEVELQNHPQLVLRDRVAVKEKTYYIYENPYALSVGFMVDNSVRDWNYSYYDPMVSQNSLFKTMTGSADNVMECVPITAANTDISSANGTTAFSISGKNTAVFKATVEKTGQVYIHVDCRAAKSINVTAAGNSWGVTTYEPYIIDAGTLQEGTEVVVTIGTENSCAGNVYVATLNTEAFENAIDTLSKNPLRIESFDDSHLLGSVYADKAGTLMTSIEFDKGWTVKVDGEEVETYAVGDALLAFDLSEGEHTVEMSFMPRGLILGVIISVMSLLCLIAWMVYYHLSNKMGARRVTTSLVSVNEQQIPEETQHTEMPDTLQNAATLEHKGEESE